MKTTTAIGLFFLLSGFVEISPALATLGQHEQSVESDRVSLRGSKSLSSQDHFRVHEIQDKDSTTTIREYASNDGMVFAVTWRGLAEPDLSQLLGSYFKIYKKHERNSTRPSRRTAVNVRSDEIVVEKAGHMRDVRGRAYVPSLVPEGVQLKDIQ